MCVKKMGNYQMIINVYRRLRTDMTEWCVFWESETVEDVVQQDIKEQKDTGRKTANGANAKGKRSETVGMGNSKEPD